MAYMRSRDKLEQAKRDGVVDVILDGIGEEISWCDLGLSLYPSGV